MCRVGKIKNTKVNSVEIIGYAVWLCSSSSLSAFKAAYTFNGPSPAEVIVQPWNNPLLQMRTLQHGLINLLPETSLWPLLCRWQSEKESSCLTPPSNRKQNAELRDFSVLWSWGIFLLIPALWGYCANVIYAVIKSAECSEVPKWLLKWYLKEESLRPDLRRHRLPSVATEANGTTGV